MTTGGRIYVRNRKKTANPRKAVTPRISSTSQMDTPAVGSNSMETLRMVKKAATSVEIADPIIKPMERQLPDFLSVMTPSADRCNLPLSILIDVICDMVLL